MYKITEDGYYLFICFICIGIFHMLICNQTISISEMAVFRQSYVRCVFEAKDIINVAN